MKKVRIWVIAWAIFLALGLALLFSHLNNFFYADDFYHLAYGKFTENPWLRVWDNHFAPNNFWRPFTILTDAVFYKLFQITPWLWRIFSLILLSLNSFLFCLLLYSLLGEGEEKWRKMVSIFAGLFFTIHPISLLTASWMSCRADLLAMLFILVALILVSTGLNRSPRFFSKYMMLCLSAGMIFSILAMLSKESALVLPGLVFLLSLLHPYQVPFKKRALNSVLILLLFSSALCIYLTLRLKLYGSLGGYEPISLSLNFILPRLGYHLPKVLNQVMIDYFFWHLKTDNPWFKILFFSYLALGLCLLPFILKKTRFFWFGAGWIVINLIPVWNLSQMLYENEARLFYISLPGLLLIIFWGVYLIEKSWLRVITLSILALILVSLTIISFRALLEFQIKSNNQKLVQDKLYSLISSKEEKISFKRIYVLGLKPKDFYYLDAMLKVSYSDWLGKLVINGDFPTLAFIKNDALGEYLGALDNPLIPEVKINYSHPNIAFITVNPPLDLAQSANDPKALFLDINKDEEIGGYLKEMAKERLLSQKRYRERRSRTRLLPTFSFLKKSYPLQWELSPNLEMVEPIFWGEPYRFISKDNDPYLISPPLSFPALAVKELEIQLRVNEKKYLAPQEQSGCLFWLGENDEDWKEENRVCWELNPDGEFHRYQIALEQNVYWLSAGKIVKIRLDPISFSGWFELDDIAFSPGPIPQEEP